MGIAIVRLSDVEQIFLVLAILYLIESCSWARRGVVSFTSVAGHFNSFWRGFSPLSNGIGRVVLTGPLPGDATFFCEPVPVSVTADGVVGFLEQCPAEVRRPLQSELFFEWETLRNVQAHDRQVRAGSGLLCVVRTDYAAKRLASQLAELARLSRDERARRIDDWVARDFDLTGTAATLGTFRAQTVWLRRTATALSVCLFPVGPLLYYGVIPGIHRPAMLVTYIGLTILLWWWTVRNACRVHRSLYPDRKGGWLKLAITGLLSPGVALRAYDHLARDLFDCLHPATLAAALLPRPAFLEFAARVWRDMEHPSYPLVPSVTGTERCPAHVLAVVAGHSARNREWFRKLLSQVSVETSDLRMTPAGEPLSLVAWCPRCLREFESVDAECTDCGDRPLVSSPGFDGEGLSH